MALGPDQVRRYARHVLLPDVGGVGQARLLAAAIALDPRAPAERAAFDYLVAAGVGAIALLASGDGDGDGDAAALIARAAALNPDVRVVVDPASRAPRLPLAEIAAGARAATDGATGTVAAALVAGGAAATLLLHRLATAAPLAPAAPTP